MLHRISPCSIKFQCSRAHDGDEAQNVLIEVGGHVNISAHSRHMIQRFQRQWVFLLLDRHRRLLARSDGVAAENLQQDQLCRSTRGRYSLLNHYHGCVHNRSSTKYWGCLLTKFCQQGLDFYRRDTAVPKPPEDFGVQELVKPKGRNFPKKSKDEQLERTFNNGHFSQPAQRTQKNKKKQKNTSAWCN